MQITHFSSHSAEARALEKVFMQALGRGKVRSKEEIESFFADLELLPPGVVFNPEWRPDEPVQYPLDLGGLMAGAGWGASRNGNFLAERTGVPTHPCFDQVS